MKVGDYIKGIKKRPKGCKYFFPCDKTRGGICILYGRVGRIEQIWKPLGENKNLFVVKFLVRHDDGSTHCDSLTRDCLKVISKETAMEWRRNYNENPKH